MDTFAYFVKIPPTIALQKSIFDRNIVDSILLYQWAALLSRSTESRAPSKQILLSKSGVARIESQVTVVPNCTLT